MQNIIKKIFDKKAPPVLIAEISANHTGSLKKAKKLILTAKKNGADLVKLQTYEPRNMTINSSQQDFLIKDGLWKGYKLWDLYKEAQTPFKWQKELFDYHLGTHISSREVDRQWHSEWRRRIQLEARILSDRTRYL